MQRKYRREPKSLKDYMKTHERVLNEHQRVVLGDKSGMALEGLNFAAGWSAILMARATNCFFPSPEPPHSRNMPRG